MTSHYESLGMTIIEAMQFGLPVVSVDCPTGPREILGDSEYGILIEQNNVSKLAEAIITLMEDEKKYQHYVEKGLARANDFSVESIHKKWEKLFHAEP